MNLILLGPPGAGKGTQAKFIAKKFNLYQLSTGDLLREEIKNKTEIGKKIKQVIAHGDFVVDEIVNQLLKQLPQILLIEIVLYLMDIHEILIKQKIWKLYLMLTINL